MNICLFFIALLLLSASSYASPLVPADSLRNVRIGDSASYYFSFGPPCPFSMPADRFTITSKDTNNFTYGAYSGQMFYAYFIPRSIGIHYDTVRFQIQYHYNSPVSCKSTFWDSGPIVLAYRGVSDSATNIMLISGDARMGYDSTSNRYVSKSKNYFQLINNVDDSTSFKITMEIAPLLFQKKIAVALGSDSAESLSLLPYTRRYQIGAYLISDSIVPFKNMTLIPYKLNCHVKNRSMDSTLLLNTGFLYFDSVSNATNAVKEPNKIIPHFRLANRQSNLFITLNLETAALTTLTIFNITGKIVARIADGITYQPGTHQIEYTPSSLPSGKYFLQFTTKEGVKIVPFNYLR